MILHPRPRSYGSAKFCRIRAKTPSKRRSIPSESRADVVKSCRCAHDFRGLTMSSPILFSLASSLWSRPPDAAGAVHTAATLSPPHPQVGQKLQLNMGSQTISQHPIFQTATSRKPHQILRLKQPQRVPNMHSVTTKSVMETKAMSIAAARSARLALRKRFAIAIRTAFHRCARPVAAWQQPAKTE